MKKVWLVNFSGWNYDLRCCWSSKEKAIEYFKKVCEERGWEWKLFEEYDEDCINYDYYDVSADSWLSVDILTLLLDEEPCVKKNKKLGIDN